MTNRGSSRSLYYFIRLILFSLFSDARMCLSLFSLPVTRPFHQLGLVSKAKSRQTAEILEFVCQASLKLAWMQDKKHTKSKKFRICLPLKLEADLKTGKKADKRQENLKIYAAQEKASSQDVCGAQISAKGSQTNLSLARRMKILFSPYCWIKHQEERLESEGTKTQTRTLMTSTSKKKGKWEGKYCRLCR